MRALSIRPFAAITIALVAAAAALAGPLNPPAGAITSTAKPLGEVEPRTAINATNTPGNAAAKFIINQPGSYYLTADALGDSGKYGIIVNASNVRIDLNGFALRGVTGAFGGILSQGTGLSNIEVCNGSVVGWGGIGIDFYTNGVNGAPGAIIRNVRVSGSTFDGIKVWYNSRVENCTAQQNGGSGFYCGNNSFIVGCQANQNSLNGFTILSQTLIERCVSDANSGGGIVTGLNCTVSGCVASGNTANGMEMGAGTRASLCTVSGNNAYGLYIGQACAVSDSTVRENATSAARIAGTACTISHCTLEGVSGFPVITVDAVNNTRIDGNTITGGTNAVSATGVPNALVTCNQCIGQTSTVFSLHANAQFGASVTATGSIGAVSPFANFIR